MLEENNDIGKETGQIAFIYYHDSNFEIYVMNFNGTGLLNITSKIAHNTMPTLIEDNILDKILTQCQHQMH